MIPGDVPGPITMGIAVTDAKAKSRLVLISCGRFLSFGPQLPDNKNFFVSCLSWIENQRLTLSEDMSDNLPRPLSLDKRQSLILGGIFIVLIPLACFAGGLVVWLRRRHL
jgi:hypothetical protein